MKNHKHSGCPLKPLEQKIFDLIAKLSLNQTKIYHTEVKTLVAEWCPANKYSGLISSISRKGYISTAIEYSGGSRQYYCEVVKSQ